MAPTVSGMMPFLVGVEPVEPNTYDQGFGMEIPDDFLAAYQVGWVNIATEPGCIEPVCYAEATTPTPWRLSGIAAVAGWLLI